jgi:hypothetical protein
MKGFSHEWRALINNLVSRVSASIKVNNDTGFYFWTKKILRQGDPLSAMLFNIVANMLANMIERVKVDGQIEGLIPYFMDGDYQSFNMKMTQFFLWSMILRRLKTFN